MNWMENNFSALEVVLFVFLGMLFAQAESIEVVIAEAVIIGVLIVGMVYLGDKRRAKK